MFSRVKTLRPRPLDQRGKIYYHIDIMSKYATRKDIIAVILTILCFLAIIGIVYAGKAAVNNYIDRTVTRVIKEQGERGPRGLQGPRGLKGDKGDRGPRGLKGERGRTGERGSTGKSGPKGPKGDTGPRGHRGIRGPDGRIGPSGPQGQRGPQGPQGPPGPIGLPGPAGPTPNVPGGASGEVKGPGVNAKIKVGKP